MGGVKRIEDILAAKRLDALVEVSNPIDINQTGDAPQIAEAFLRIPTSMRCVADPTAPRARSVSKRDRRREIRRAPST
jgi:hypothetical protein